MIEFLHDLRAIDPRLPYLLTAAIVGAVIWGWQRLAPKSFAELPSQVKALPAAALGAILTASTSDDLNHVAVDLVFGAFAGVTAVGGHETLRRLTLPTTAPDVAPPSSPTVMPGTTPTAPAPVVIDPESKGDV